MGYGTPIRIGPTTNEERQLINVLTTDERRELLVKAGQKKIQQMNAGLQPGQTIVVMGRKFRIDCDAQDYISLEEVES